MTHLKWITALIIAQDYLISLNDLITENFMQKFGFQVIIEGERKVAW